MKKTLAFLSCVVVCAATLHATPITYKAVLSGVAEDPSNASPGTGKAIISLDDAAHTLSLDVTFSGLLGTTTASHIHCCTATPGSGNVGVATQTPTFSGFPLGVSSGSYSMLFDLTLATSWNASFISNNGGTPASAEAVFGTGVDEGRAYLNIHTSAFPGGEIRGFLTRVPEPATLLLLVFGGAGLLASRTRR